MTIKTILMTLILLIGLGVTQVVWAESPTEASSSRQTVTLDMQNMTCAMCKITIKKALQEVDGVEAVKVDSESKTSAITFDSGKTNIDALIKATTNAGYPATVHQPKQ